MESVVGQARRRRARPLLVRCPQVITFRCRGYIFFGSTLQIMDDVMSSIVFPPPNTASAAASAAASTTTSRHSTPDKRSGGDGGGAGGGGGAASDAPPTRFVLFDFTMVSGLDATAARSCFLNLCRTLTPLGIQLVFGGLRPGGHIEKVRVSRRPLRGQGGRLGGRAASLHPSCVLVSLACGLYAICQLPTAE